MEKETKKTTAPSATKPNYYAVQFKRERVDYFIDRNHLPLKKGTWVMVQAERGHDLGRIHMEIDVEHMPDSHHKYPLEILHIAKPAEMDILEENREREKDAFRECREMIEFRGLDMKLVDCEIQFDGNKITFYFTAEHRVDFRELVKDLASIFRTRIELRQIGVRDETKKLGGLGPCGLELCCARWLDDFKPISTQYARDQNLAVNPNKLSGPCGRLFCCLDYEQEFYEEARAEFPSEDAVITHGDSKFAVLKMDFFKGQIHLRDLKNESIEILPIEEFRCRFCVKDKSWLDRWLPKGDKK